MITAEKFQETWMHGDQTPQYFQAIPHLEKKYRNVLAAPWTSGLSLVGRFETVFAQNEEIYCSNQVTAERGYD